MNSRARLVFEDHFSKLRMKGLEENVFMHSSIIGLGSLVNRQIGQGFDRALAASGIRLILPSFSYSWCNDMVFDPSVVDDSMGYFSKYFLDAGFYRTPNPNTSVLIDPFLKKQLKIEENGVSEDCFGPKSIFSVIYDRFLAEKSLSILLFGGAHGDCLFRSTWIHYVEQMVGVPYRHVKRFFDPGAETSDSKSIPFCDQYCMNRLDEVDGVQGKSTVRYDFSRLGRDLVREGILRSANIENSSSRFVNLFDFVDFLSVRLRLDPYYLLSDMRV